MPAVIYKRERDLLEFISQYMQKNGFAPTLADICDGLGLRSPATVAVAGTQGDPADRGGGREHLIEILRRQVRKLVGVRGAVGAATHPALEVALAADELDVEEAGCEQHVSILPHPG